MKEHSFEGYSPRRPRFQSKALGKMILKNAVPLSYSAQLRNVWTEAVHVRQTPFPCVPLEWREFGKESPNLSSPTSDSLPKTFKAH
jgi:hypothetical protein